MSRPMPTERDPMTPIDFAGLKIVIALGGVGHEMLTEEQARGINAALDAADRMQTALREIEAIIADWREHPAEPSGLAVKQIEDVLRAEAREP